MEKSVRSDRPPQRRGFALSPKLRLVAAVAATTLVCALTALPTPPAWRPWAPQPAASHAAGSTPGEFSWADISPSKNLTWQSCYDDDYECARFDVPMDWLAPTMTERVVLAVIRLPAMNRKDYRGPVFFNPGGPGGSGIWSMRDHGKLLQTIVGDNHDIISFDPRGVGKSTPRIQCWEDYQREHFWRLQDIGSIDEHPGVVYDEFARAGAYSQICEMANAPSGILRHSSTASHARDLLAMLDQLGQRELRYWGFSYGTVLGGTFAAMFPDRVGRLVSDGNVDYREWHLKTHVNFLRDTDKVLAGFFTLCHQAGPAACAFYTGDTPAAIEARFDRLRERLRRHPVVVPASLSVGGGPEVPEIVTYAKLMRLLSSTLYQPHHAFARFATIVDALDRGDGWPYYDHMAHIRPPFASVCAAESRLPTVPPPGLAEGTDDAFPAIMCADSVPEIADPEDFDRRVVGELEAISRAGGAIGAHFRLACVGRTVRPKDRFAGPWEANTSFPILYVNNMADNVTPLVSARNNSAGFPGSVVLVQHSYGHTSLASPSTCTAQHIRAYFQQGVVPPADSECLPDALPFGLPSGAQIEADSELTRAVAALARQMDARGWRQTL